VLVLPIVLIVAAVAILGGVIVVAMGRGGELAPSSADVRPLDTDIVTAADVALLRPPAALWGYDMRATDEALNLVARTVTERDVEIADLRQQLADMQSGADDPHRAGNPRHAAGSPDTAGYEVPDQGAYEPGSSPPALPFRRAVGGPTRPPGGEQSWSAWQRPREATGDDPGDYPETGTATRGRG
jgi:hypothetical protein